jgi:16S rRNA (adenine1518-N6/adenine1519-N6)-dimethyltransferase
MQPDSRDKPSSAKQTLSFLLRRFQQAGIEPRTDLGQNFLIDMNLQRVLLETAQIGPDDVVLEVGTGTGGLTMQMAPLAAAVVSVEVDRDLHQLAGEELFHFPSVTLLHTDVLKTKSRIEPAVLEAVQRQLEAGRGTPGRRRWKLVANLPYNVATPLISNLLALDRPPCTMTVTVQKEVADRIVARPGGKDYGGLAIWIQSQCRAEIVRVLAPSVFWPRPKVSSAFVQIALDEALRQRIPDRAYFHDFVRSMFVHRRKVLRSELLSARKQFQRVQVDELLAALGLEPTVRAERLGPADMLRLCEAVRLLESLMPACRHEGLQRGKAI